MTGARYPAEAVRKGYVMGDWEAVIVGAGPAGLAAGTRLSRDGCRAIVLEKENFGGHLLNLERVKDHPGFPGGVAGTHLAAQMLKEAEDSGLELERGEAAEIELYTSRRWVQCKDGTGHCAPVVIIAGGLGPKRLGVPGEEELSGKGLFTCATCEGGLLADRVVAVCSAGDAGVADALYLAQWAARVIVLDAMPSLCASPGLRQQAVSNPKLEIRCGVRVEAIQGAGRVEAIDLLDQAIGHKETLSVDGVLVNVGLEPNTGYLLNVVPLESHGRIVVNDRMETGVPGVLAAGDIRSGSSGLVVDAVNDAAVAALSARSLIRASA